MEIVWNIFFTQFQLQNGQDIGESFIIFNALFKFIEYRIEWMCVGICFKIKSSLLTSQIPIEYHTHTKKILIQNEMRSDDKNRRCLPIYRISGLRVRYSIQFNSTSIQ